MSLALASRLQNMEDRLDGKGNDLVYLTKQLELFMKGTAGHMLLQDTAPVSPAPEVQV